MEDGKIKPVTDEYLVDALSFTEAENRFIEEITPFMTGEFEVTDIKRFRIAEVVDNVDATADRWYRVKVVFITLDEKSGQEKKTAQSILVKAPHISGALEATVRCMEGTLGEWNVQSIVETNILDVIKYEGKS